MSALPSCRGGLRRLTLAVGIARVVNFDAPRVGQIRTPVVFYTLVVVEKWRLATTVAGGDIPGVKGGGGYGSYVCAHESESSQGGESGGEMHF
jgi:hypothetical protein